MRAGAPKPDISSIEAFKRALLNAKSIGYLKVGSGVYLATLLDRLGIAETIAPKVTRLDADTVSQLVAKGEIELGMVVILQIMTTPGVELVGPLPPEIQSYITFTGAVSANARVPDTARELLQFLRGPNARRVIKWPARPNLNGVPATVCQGSSESSVQPDLVRLSPEQLHRPELPEARCLPRAGGVVMFQ